MATMNLLAVLVCVHGGLRRLEAVVNLSPHRIARCVK